MDGKRMVEGFGPLFEPVRIAGVQIANRIAMAPMSAGGLINTDGSLTQRCIDYYTERARGGAGLIITGCIRVENTVEHIPGPMPPGYEAMPSYGELAESLHYYGSKIFVQLTAGIGRVLSPEFLEIVGSPVSSSVLPAFWKESVLTRELAREEIQQIVEAFGEVAGRLASCGIDGIELHGHEGYLFDQFAAALWNKRSDRYGGSVEGRLRFAVEVLNAIKKEAGADFPVVYQFGLKHYIKGKRPGALSGALPGDSYEEAGRDIAEGLELTRCLEKSGFDALHVDAGCHESWYWAHPPLYQEHGCTVDLAAMVKSIVDIPVIAVGRLEIPELAQSVVAKGQADIIALGRGLLADPYWPMKAKSGDYGRIRPCIGCHYCLKRTTQDRKPLSCAVNPACGRERLHDIAHLPEARRIMVIGGGVGGMEAARAVALRGHNVELYEAGSRVGGQLLPAAVPVFNQDLGRLRDWYEGQLIAAGVTINCGVRVTPEIVRAKAPDAVVVATGSTPIRPQMPGAEGSNVTTCTDLLLGRGRCGSHVVVAGGNLIGCQVALWLARQEKKVTIVERLPEISTGAFYANENMLLDMLEREDVVFLTGMRICEINPEGIVVTDDVYKTVSVRCDTLVLATDLKPERTLYDSLKMEIPEIYAVGDVKRPGTIQEAIWDGFHVGQAICGRVC